MNIFYKDKSIIVTVNQNFKIALCETNAVKFGGFLWYSGGGT